MRYKGDNELTYRITPLQNDPKQPERDPMDSMDSMDSDPMYSVSKSI